MSRSIAAAAMVALVTVGFPTSTTYAQPSPEDAVKNAIAGVIEGYLIDELSDLKFSKKNNWDRKIKTPFGKKKDGFWKRYSVTPEDVKKRTDFKILEVKRLSSTSAEICCRLSTFVRGKAQAKLWKLGAELGSTSAEARATVIVEVCIKLKLKGNIDKAEFSIVPKITESDVDIKDFELDKLGAIGGYSAKVIGDALESLGKDALEKAETKLAEAIANSLQQAAEKNEVRVSLRDFLKK
jgi:hypothetical protein